MTGEAAVSSKGLKATEWAMRHPEAAKPTPAHSLTRMSVAGTCGASRDMALSN